MQPSKLVSLGIVLLFLITVNSWAFRAVQDRLPNVDLREAGKADNPVTPAQGHGVQRLKQRLHSARVDFDPITGAPGFVRAHDGFLTGARGQGRSVASETAAAFAGQEHRATKSFLKEHRAVFGYGPELLDGIAHTRESVSAHNQLRTVIWEQELDGLEIYNARLISHTTKDEELVNVSASLVANPAEAANRGTPQRNKALKNPRISAREAIRLAAANIEEEVASAELVGVDDAKGAEKRQSFKPAGGLVGETEARLIWLPMDGETLKLCWDVQATSQKRGEMFRVLVDADTGEVLIRHGLTEYFSDASFRVFPSDSPTPMSPGHATPSSTQPPLASRVLVVTNALSTNASPNGWINDGDNQTLGNNVDAHLDRDANNVADPGSRPQGSPARVFDFPMDLTQAPSTYTNAAVVQLFYWCNWMHDVLYDLGFTESGRNFQTTNFNRGGLGNDALQADAQDGSGVNNANMSTPSDGSSPRMQMFIFTGPTPDTDGDFDTEVVLHEYTHGLSNRRVGGGVGLSASQSRGMGEGWSDFYGLALLSESGDAINGNYAAGAYASYLLSGLTQNYYYGIRRYPYSTDMTKNPLTFKDIDPSRASSHTGIPKSPLGGGTADEVHNQGEVWCVTLWDARANLINKYGFHIGNRLILQLVTDGMNLSPANPTFLQARDAIIQADRVNNAGANVGELWAAFAKRGMGFYAVAPASSTTSGVIENFSMPDDLALSPSQGFMARGPVNGPFTPSSQTYAVSNIGTNSLSWSAGGGSWLSATPNSGTLAPGATTNVVVALNSAAVLYVTGIYTNVMRFTNVTSGVVQEQQFTLAVGQPDYFTELFASADNDIDNQTLTFTPDGSTSFYSVCREPATVLPTPLAGGSSVSVPNHSFTTVYMGAGTNVSLYGFSTNVFHIGSGGFITLKAGDNSYTESLAAHFTLLRISGLMCHLHPGDVGGAVFWQALSNRVAVTFSNVIDFTTSATSTFQMEMFFDGRIRMTHLTIGATGGLVGLSRGTGTPSVFIESDLNGYHQCIPPLVLRGPTNVVEGEGIVNGTVTFPTTANTNRVVALQRTGASEVAVPASVTVPAGATNATFAITVSDDNDLDGTQVATITASALPYVVTHSLSVTDNETAVLSVTLPAAVGENAGSAQGTVAVSEAVAADVAVGLISGDLTEVIVPATTVIPAGQTSAVFTLTVVNDREIDGAQSVSVTAQVPNWTGGAATMTVLDDESTNLVVVLPSQTREGLSSFSGTVRLGGTLSTNVGVALSSGNTNEITVPAMVTVSAGQTSAVFQASVVNDAILDGDQTVSISAAAPGFGTGAATILVTDDETPPAPSSPIPSHLATNIVANTSLRWSLIETGAVRQTVFDVYLGSSPSLGTNDLVGSTTNLIWTPPLLAPLTTYYWKVVARRLAETSSPVWQFTTRGVDHFEWSTVPSPQYMDQAFTATVTAKDSFNTTVSNYTGTVRLMGQIGGGDASRILVTELEQLDPDTAEFINASTSAIDISGWKISVYDYTSFPSPLLTYTIPQGSISQPGQVFRLVESGSYPGSYPTFYTGTNINWITATTGNQMAVLVRDASGAISDFVCAVDANPSSIVNPVSIPTNQWSGSPVPANFNSTSYTYQRVGNRDQNRSNDWAHAIVSVGTLNSNLVVPFQGGSAFIPITPTNSTPFSNGVWTGAITVSVLATNMNLVATDENASGVGNVFSVVVTNDVGISISTNAPVSPGQAFTYNITVTNTGPLDAADVTVTNTLPAGFAIASAGTSQGSVTTNGATVVVNVGVLSAGTNAVITVTGIAGNVGNYVNFATVSRSGVDPFPANNEVTAPLTVVLPTLRINDVSLAEGNSGTSLMLFTVSLSAAVSQTVSVNFATASSSATTSDYISTNGTLVFAPGQTNRSIAVAIIGDTTYESSETFFVNLSGATNATIADAQGVGTILNDDATPLVYISDSSVVEGNSGTTNYAQFTISIAPASALNVTVGYYTSSSSASSGIDYVSVNTSVTFAPGETNKIVLVPIIGDDFVEVNEIFYLYGSSVSGGSFGDSTGICTILDDDSTLTVGDRLEWRSVRSPQQVSTVISAQLTAKTSLGAVKTNASFAVALSAASLPGAKKNILGAALPSDSGNFGAFTLGYAIRPSTNLVVTHARHLAGSKLSIWADNGTLLASQSISGVPGSWSETPLVSPVQLTAGTRYRISVYTADAVYYWFTNGSSTFGNGTIEQGYYSAGDSFPTNTSTTRWFGLDISYFAGMATPVSITPTNATLAQGVWSGNITLGANVVSNLILIAKSGTVTGNSNPFDVIADCASPPIPANPMPVNGATNVALNSTLAWGLVNGFGALEESIVTSATFPSSNSIVVGNGTFADSTQTAYFWSATRGDSVTQTFSTSLTSITRAVFDLHIPSNSLLTNSPLNWGVWINNVEVGTFSVVPQQTGFIHLEFACPYITGTNYTVQLKVLNTVPSGNGAHNFTYAGAYAGTVQLIREEGAACPTAFDVYMGTDGPVLTKVAADLAEPIFTPALLGPNTTYYWQVVSKRNNTQVTGPLWRFTTRPPPVLHHFAFSSIPATQFAGSAFAVSITARDEYDRDYTNFSGSANLSLRMISPATNSILPNNATNPVTGIATATMGYSFTPNTNVTVTHFRHCFGTKISIWSDTGVLLRSQSVTNFGGVWLETPLSTPLQLTAGTRYRIGAYTGAGGTYHGHSGLTNRFAFGTIDQSLQSSGDALPMNSDSWRYTLVDLRFAAPVAGAVLPSIVNFTNGLWAGNATAMVPGTNATLRVDDNAGHAGESNPLDIMLRDDISITAVASPALLTVGGTLSYTLVVSNSGPVFATGVVVSNPLPANTILVSASSSQGAYTNEAGLLRFDIGSIAPASNVTVTIVLIAPSPGIITNQAGVSRAEPEFYPGNNSAIVTSPVILPSIRISDTTVAEGNSGETNALFVISIVPSPNVETSVAFTSSPGSATTGPDFLATNGTVVFAPGETNKSVLVTVYGDVLNEGNETFFVNLSSPTNAVIADSSGLATIIDDDPLPLLYVDDVAVVEGNSGITNAVFRVSLSAPSGRSVSVFCATAPSSALAGSDYATTNATISFPAGQTNMFFSVAVFGDTTVETNELFFVNLSGASSAAYGDTQGIGTIISDDLMPILVSSGYRLTGESYSPTNGVIDPGEIVTVEFVVKNTGSIATTNLWAALQGTGGVELPSAPQNYGALPIGGVPVARPFTFKAATTNGSSITATLQLQDASPLGSLAFFIPVGSATDFMITSLSTSGSFVVDHNSITGDDRGGIAASSTHVFYTGDSGSGRFSITNLSGGAAIGSLYDALVSNLKTEQVYCFGNGTNIVTSTLGTATSLVELSGTTGLRTTNYISLSSPVPFGPGFFSGFDRIVTFNSGRVYNIDLPSGNVTDMGAVPSFSYRTGESGAFWGVAEYFNGAIHLVYVQSSTAIARTRVPDGTTSLLATFSNLSDMSSFTVSIPRGRWYFHHEYSSQFGGVDETIGYASATFNILEPAMSPWIRAMSPSQNGMVLSWTSKPGKNYRVQYKTNLNDTVWVTLPGDIFSTGTISTKIDTNRPALRFYRIQMLP